MAKTLLQKLPPPPNKYGIDSVKNFYRNLNITTKFQLKPTTEGIVLKLLKNIDISQAAGIDNLPGRFLKDGAVILAKPVTEICNLSIKSRIFPDPCKLAKLKPIFKKRSRMDPSSYRPISLLPLISKIFEKIVHDQMIDYLSQYNILYKYQPGFRAQHSTDLCLSYLNDKILKGFDNGFFTGMILIDLQKPFDTIDHNILLEKLKAIGFCDDTVSWFRSYLTDRAFLGSTENKYLSISKISCGVPQGSILGPLLFLIYVSDMKQTVSSDLLLYDDDSCLVFQHKHVTEIETHLNNDFSNLCEWFLDNKLSIHFGEDKTKSIVFGTKRKLRKVGKLNITYQGINIKQNSQVTYLGCILDETMSGEPMAYKTIKKLTLGSTIYLEKSTFWHHVSDGSYATH